MMPTQSLPATVLSVSALLAAVCTSACGKSDGDTVGRDPSVPISLSPSKDPAQDKSRPVASEPSAPPSPEQPAGQRPIAEPPPSADAPANPGGNPTVPSRPTLTVFVKDLRNTNGNFCMSIFNSPDGFPDSAEKAILAECFAITQNSFSIEIRDFPAGRYAIAGWHDENKDKKLNYQLIFPKEGLAFSENGKPRLAPPPGPPAFDAIAFQVGTENTSTQMKTTYLLDLL